MPQPTPEQLWEALDPADRQEIQQAAAGHRRSVSRELADRLQAIGVPVSNWGIEAAEPTVFVIPQQYLDYAREQADG